MNPQRLTEIKNIIKHALNEINQNDPEWDELELERKPYTNNATKFANPDDTGEFTTDQIEEVLVDLFEELANKTPDLKSIHDILDKPEIGTGYAVAALTHGNEDDKVSVSKGEFTIGEAKPTQKEIFWMKSVLFGCAETQFDCTAAQSLKNEATSNKHLQVNFAKIGGDTYILDGHHRWSGQFAFGEINHTMSGLNFQFQSDVLQRALAALQVAIAANVGLGANIPSATGGKSGTNIFEASPEALAEELLAAAGQSGSSWDSKMGEVVLGEQWFEAVLSMAGSEFKTWLKNAIVNVKKFNVLPDRFFEDIKEKGTEFSGGQEGSGTRTVGNMPPHEMLLEAREKDPAKMPECPCRKVIAYELARRYKLVPQASGDLPDRKDMPQLDGDTGTTKRGKKVELEPKNLAKMFNAGHVNHEINFTLPELPEGQSATNESINLQRWGKLAGLLKD